MIDSMTRSLEDAWDFKHSSLKFQFRQTSILTNTHSCKHPFLQTPIPIKPFSYTDKLNPHRNQPFKEYKETSPCRIYLE